MDFPDELVDFQHSNHSDAGDGAQGNTTDGFEGYVEDTVDPSPYPLLSIIVLGAMSYFLVFQLSRRQPSNKEEAAADMQLKEDEESPCEDITSTLAKEESLNTNANAHEHLNDTACYKCLRIVTERCGFDRETKKICKLAFPLVSAAIIHGVTEIARVMIVGNYLGTRELSAIVVVDSFVSITTDSLRGIHQSLITLCSHSIGTNNGKLTGQYVQIVVFLYTILSIPVSIFWIAIVGSLVSWLGFDEATVALAESFTVYLVIARTLEGIAKGFDSLLDVSGHEVFSTVYAISVKGTTVLILFLWAILTEGPSLDMFGAILVLCDLAGAIGLVLIVASAGWFQDYNRGLFGTFAFTNWEAVKTVLRTSSAIMFGYLLTYGEWEILTVFASFLGPAETAAWSILGVVWDLLEQITEAVADASEIRCAYFLGAGEPAAAKVSAYKSVMIGFVTAVVLSIVLFLSGDALVQWLTTDSTLQGMLLELIPLVAAGNVALSMGVMAWTLLGSQGRYQLATIVGFGGTFLLTMPISAALTIVWRVKLEGQLAACAIGYIVSGTLNTYFLLTSDWDELSMEVMKLNAEEDVMSDDESTDSNSNEMDTEEGVEPPLHDVAEEKQRCR